MAIISPINQITKNLTTLRNKQIFATITGNYKNFRKYTVEYASQAIQHPDAIKNIQAPKISAPLFSITGFKMLKIMFLELFRTKTPAEKQLKKLAQEMYIKEKYALK